uniref:Omega-Hexatoxin-Hc2c_2 n=1 Tax=Hadronyche cerberea TaxID=1107879 RepID=A0A4Q8K537_HADCE
MKFSKISITLAVFFTQAVFVFCGIKNEDFMENGFESNALHDAIKMPINSEKPDTERLLACLFGNGRCSSNKDCCELTPVCKRGSCVSGGPGLVGGILGGIL